MSNFALSKLNKMKQLITYFLIYVLAVLFIAMLLASCSTESHNCKQWRTNYQTCGPVH